jgi:hypothetical protein
MRTNQRALPFLLALVTEDGNITSTGPRSGEWELYDTTTDPGETMNLAARYPKRVTSMTRLRDRGARPVTTSRRDFFQALGLATACSTPMP